MRNRFNSIRYKASDSVSWYTSSLNERINYKLYWGRIDDQVCEVCENHTRYKGIKPNIEYIDRTGWIDSQVYERVKYSEI